MMRLRLIALRWALHPKQLCLYHQITQETARQLGYQQGRDAGYVAGLQVGVQLGHAREQIDG